ncbi:MAG: hypothetical protein GY835_21100 [bacterium]|nr:hypothetical protein [bacterium]
MSQISRLCVLTLLLLTLINTGDALSVEENPPDGVAGVLVPLQCFTPSGKTYSDTVQVTGHIDIPRVRDMCVSSMGDLLILTDKGELLLIGGDDHSATEVFDGDLDPRDRPEAVAAEGGDWLLLLDRGRRILRLGSRGEDLGSIHLTDDETWRHISGDRSGRIWLVDEIRGRLLALSSGGQELQRWDLTRLLPGFRGPLAAWCPDGQGGLWLLEVRGRTIRHLNSAGNPQKGVTVRTIDSGSVLMWSDREQTGALLPLSREDRAKLLPWREKLLLLLGGEIRILTHGESESG